MDDPLQEISHAITLCAAAESPDLQISAFHKYFSSNSSFLHPLCYVPPGPSSRTRIIGIYLFYRSVIPRTRFDINYVAFDEKVQGVEGHVFVDLVQWPEVRGLSWVTGWVPALPMHINFRVRKGEGEGGKWVIVQQEDLVQPMSMLLAIPYVRVLGRAFYLLCEVMGLLSAWVFMWFGVWRPQEYLSHWTEVEKKYLTEST